MRIPYLAAALAGVLALSLSTAALAQKGARTAPLPTAALTRLNLTAAQQEKINAASAAYKADLTAARGLTTPQEKRQAARAARNKYEAAIKAVLTPEQQAQAQKMRNAATEYRSLGRVGGQLATLNLTADQKTKVKAVMAKYQPEMDKLRAQRIASTDKKALQGQNRELQQKMTAEIRAILTPEQQQQLGGRRNGAKRKKKNGAA